MCGILGFVARHGKIDEAMVEHQLDMLKRRGPDQSGIFVDDQVALGHRRLAIIDLTEAGRQPMKNVDGNLVVTFNGEIYNYLQLKAELGDNPYWQSRSDTEVLLHGYAKWRDALVDHIEGMFAFGLYDKTAQRILLARDHFGKKPLYYYLDDEYFCFASELKAILAHPQIRSRLSVDEDAVDRYLAYGYIPSPLSIYRQIKKLDPASLRVFDIHAWRLSDAKRFWHLEQIPIIAGRTDDEVTEHIELLIKRAVAKRLMADVPLGIFLSGGVDSSVIAYHLAQQAKGMIHAYTVSYRDQEAIDEAHYAARVAGTLGLTHHCINFEEADVLACFVEVLDYLDEPLADAATIPLAYIAKYAKRDMTVVLSGDGGDEVFGGYHKYRAQALLAHPMLRKILHATVPLWAKTSAYGKLARGAGTAFAERQFTFGSGGLFAHEIANLRMQRTIVSEELFSEAFAADHAYTHHDPINRALYLDCRLQLPDWYLVKGDRASMMWGLEMRNPLLDKALAEYLFSIPGRQKLRYSATKRLLKRIASRYVDRDIIYRHKRGFAVPLNDWIRGPLKPLFDEYIRMPGYGYLDDTTVIRWYEEHLSHTQDHTFKLLRVLALRYWHQHYGIS